MLLINTDKMEELSFSIALGTSRLEQEFENDNDFPNRVLMILTPILHQ